MLSKTINSLFVGTRYGVWVLAILGIFGSVILAFVNISIGMPSILVCVAMLCLSVALALGLLPKKLVKGEFLETKRFPLIIITAVIAIGIMAIVYFVAGGFPELNLVFA